jgi:hypothetical protein
MPDRNEPRGKSLLDQARDAIDDFFGGNVKEAAERTPTAVADRLELDRHELEDIGMADRGVESAAYTGKPRSEPPEPPVTALDPF